MSIHSPIDWGFYPLQMSYEEIKRFREQYTERNWAMTKKDLLKITTFPPTPEQFRMMDECVVHVTVKWGGVVRMQGRATIYHIENDDVAVGQIISDLNKDMVYSGAIVRTTIDAVLEVPEEEPAPSNEDYAKLKDKYTELYNTNIRLFRDIQTIIDTFFEKTEGF